MRLKHIRVKALPVELWMEIFKHSSPRDLLKCRSVCKTFKSLTLRRIYKNYYARLFKMAVVNNDIGMMVKIYQYFDEESQIQSEMLSLNFGRNDSIFEYACRKGYSEIIRYIFSWVNSTEIDEWIKAHDFWVVQIASENGHLEVVRQLYYRSSDLDKYNMLKAADYYPFKTAAHNNNLVVSVQIYQWIDEVGKAALRKWMRYGF